MLFDVGRPWPCDDEQHIKASLHIFPAENQSFGHCCRPRVGSSLRILEAGFRCALQQHMLARYVVMSGCGSLITDSTAYS
jgi:hypothetical protein